MCRSRHSTTEDSAVQMKIARACEAYGWLLPPSIVHHASLSSYASCSNSRKLVGQKLDPMFGRNGGHCNKKFAIREEQYRVLSKLLQYTSGCLLGKTLHIRAHGQSLFRYHVQRGKAVHMDDYCFKMLFQCLSLKNVIYVVNCLLLEQRVLVHSGVRVSYLFTLYCVAKDLATLTARLYGLVSRYAYTGLRGTVYPAVSILLETRVYSIPACGADRISAGT